jgi:hypothetical protein
LQYGSPHNSIISLEKSVCIAKVGMISTMHQNLIIIIIMAIHGYYDGRGHKCSLSNVFL